LSGPDAEVAVALDRHGESIALVSVRDRCVTNLDDWGIAIAGIAGLQGSCGIALYFRTGAPTAADALA